MENFMSDVQNRLITIPDWNKFHSWPSVNGLRYMVAKKDTNGFKSAFKHVGKRVLIDEKAFFNCVEAQNSGQ
jgi:hypothetical protein